jgi:hypothetical protein
MRQQRPFPEQASNAAVRPCSGGQIKSSHCKDVPENRDL